MARSFKSRRWILQHIALLVFGALGGFLLLFGVELALRYADWPPAHERGSPFLEISYRDPVFVAAVRGADGTRMEWVHSSFDNPTEQERGFILEKPGGEFRIFVVGESSAAGVPAGIDYAFSTWLERRLCANAPDRRWEVINAARPGTTSSRTLSVVNELSHYSPDLVVVYAGHNEWINRRFYSHLVDMDPRRLRLYEGLLGSHLYAAVRRWGRLSAAAPIEIGEIEQFLGAGSARENPLQGPFVRNETERRLGEELYRDNIERMISTVHAAGSEIMLLSLGQNLTHWVPLRSKHRGGLSAAELSDWQRLYDRARVQAANGDHTGAAAAYQEAIRIDDEFAEIHFHYATCLRSLARVDDARRHFRRASDLDVSFSRAPLGFNDIVREVGRRRNVPFVDIFAALEQMSPDHLIGDEFFADAIHPNIRAHQVIAERVETEMRARNMGGPASWGDVYVDPDIDRLLSNRPEVLAMEYINWIIWCSQNHRRSDDCLESPVTRLLRLNQQWPDLRERLTASGRVKASDGLDELLRRLELGRTSGAAAKPFDRMFEDLMQKRTPGGAAQPSD